MVEKFPVFGAVTVSVLCLGPKNEREQQTIDDHRRSCAVSRLPPQHLHVEMTWPVTWSRMFS